MPASPSTLRIITRNSPLALWQADYVKAALLVAHPHLQISIQGLLTEGDKLLSASLSKIGGKGLFIKELQATLLEKTADIAVHSLKDIPAYDTPELLLAAYCEREDPKDVLVSNRYAHFNDLPKGAVIGTSSSRRMCLLHSLRPDLKVEPLRGNIGTRLRKLDEGQYDAIILAAAGLKRLGESQRIRCYLEIDPWIPAVGQGSVGVECRESDLDVIDLLAPLNHASTRTAIIAERACNQALNGGCQLPIAVHAVCVGEQLMISGFVGDPSEQHPPVRATLTGVTKEPEILGKQLAGLLLEKGAGEILQRLV